jgi:hypothetical protein
MITTSKSIVKSSKFKVIPVITIIVDIIILILTYFQKTAILTHSNHDPLKICHDPAVMFSVARTEKQNIAQFSPKIAQNVASRDEEKILLKKVAQKSPF